MQSLPLWLGNACIRTWDSATAWRRQCQEKGQQHRSVSWQLKEYSSLLPVPVVVVSGCLQQAWKKAWKRIEGSAELEGKENCQELVRGRAGSLVEGCLRSRAGRRAHTRALNPFLQAFCSASCSAPDILSSCRSADASSSPYSSDAICVAKFKIVSVFLF